MDAQQRAVSAAPGTHGVAPQGEAGFTDLSTLLSIARIAENRLKLHLHPRQPYAMQFTFLENAILSLHRLTSIRKTLIDLYHSIHTPPNPSGTRAISPQPESAPYSAPATTPQSISEISNPGISSPHSVPPANSAGAVAKADLSIVLNPSSLGPPSSSAPSRLSVGACPTLRGTADPASALNSVNALIDKLEHATANRKSAAPTQAANTSPTSATSAAILRPNASQREGASDSQISNSHVLDSEISNSQISNRHSAPDLISPFTPHSSPFNPSPALAAALAAHPRLAAAATSTDP